MTTEHAPWLFWLVIAILLGGFIYLISPILLPFIVGLGVAYLLDPLADRLEAWGLSRTKATIVISGLFFAVITLVLVALVPMLLEQFMGLMAELPRYFQMLRGAIEPYIQHWSQELQLDGQGDQYKELAAGLASSSKEFVSGMLAGLLKSGLALVNFAALLVITPLVSFYLLRDWDKMVADVDDLLPRHYAPVIREQLGKIDETLAAFLRGQLNVMLVLGAFYAVALSIAGLNYALIIALVAGALVIIPYVGTIVSGALAVGVAYVQFDDLERTGIVLAIFVAGQMLEGYVLTPKLVGNSVGLNPLWIIFGMMAGGALMGFVGMLIAVPVTAVCGVLLRFAVSRYRESGLYQEGNGSA